MSFLPERWRWRAVLTVVAALALAGCWPARAGPTATPAATATTTLTPTPSHTPTTVPAPPTPTPPAGDVPRLLGVTTRGETYDPAVQKLMAQAGVRWVRTSVWWESIEPAPGEYTWAAFDNHMLTLAGIGVIPVVYVTANPAWAASSRCGPIDRVDLDAFGRFVSALAKRYDGTTVVNRRTLPRVDYWQFYNEPDNRWTTGVAAGFDGCWGEAGAQYAQMLSVAYAAVHAANPEAHVVFGGIAAEDMACAATWECAGQAIFNFDMAGDDFTDDVLAYMAAHPDSRYFDIFDLHYYPSMHTRWDDYGAGLIGKVEYYRGRLKLWGVTRPFMCTESGRRSDAAQKVDGLPGSDDEQSAYVVKLFAQAAHLELVNVLWFNLTDIVESKQGGAAGWGLLSETLKPKPSYAVYAALHRELTGMLYQGQTDVADETAVEGYDYAAAGRRTTLLWSRAGVHAARFHTAQATVVSLSGRETVVRDGGGGDADGKVDGVVTITVTTQPVYVRWQP